MEYKLWYLQDFTQTSGWFFLKFGEEVCFAFMQVEKESYTYTHVLTALCPGMLR